MAKVKSDGRPIPKTIKVLGRTYRVYIGRRDDELKRDGTWGEVLHLRGTIDLRSDLGPEARWETLWHEIIHCLDHLLLENKDGIALKEAQIVPLANGLVAVMRDNARLT